MTLFVRHCEGQRPEAISQLRLLRRRNDDLAVTLLTGHSEPQSGEESLRLLCKRKDELAGKEKDNTTTSQGSLCVTASEAKQSQNQRIRDCFARRKNEFAMTSPLVVARAESPKQPRH
jgi:hypothetical protein